MRFQRSDLPGLIVAVVGPVLLFVLLLEAYQLWSHHGSPILGILSVHIAIGGGIVGAFWRFIRARDAVIGLTLGLVMVVVGVLALQASGNDGSLFSTLLKLVGVLLFGALNVVFVQQLLWNGLNPVLVRRDQARAAADEQA